MLAWCWKSQHSGRNVGNVGHAASRPAGINGSVQAKSCSILPREGRELLPNTRLLLQPKRSPSVLLTDATGSRARTGIPWDLLCARSFAMLPWLLSWLSWVLLASCLFADSNRSSPKEIKPN